MKYFPLFQVFVFFTKVRIFFQMCSYISHMLNHFRCEPLKNVFCFVRNRLMLDDAMNSVYSGKRYLFQLACLCVMCFFCFVFFFWYIYVSVSAAIKCCSQSYVFVGFFFLANQNSSSRTATACWYFIGWKKVRKPTENPNCVDVLIVCLNYV